MPLLEAESACLLRQHLFGLCVMPSPRLGKHGRCCYTLLRATTVGKIGIALSTHHWQCLMLFNLAFMCSESGYSQAASGAGAHVALPRCSISAVFFDFMPMDGELAVVAAVVAEMTMLVGNEGSAVDS